ncbi:telomere length regulation protein TEL2 homolog [Rhopilema esculentum]|uniref:telomere length regulation protein TEL2 homolog n=1 Tax=Rhopilema esculentum TaxID=499914 RepID=UPI0031D0A7C6
MADSVAEAGARTFLKEIASRLSSVNDEVDFIDILKSIHPLLFKDSTQTKYFELEVDSKRIFVEKFYQNLLELLLGTANCSWFDRFKKKKYDDLRSLFIEGQAESVFLGLTVALSKAKHTNIIKECVSLLETFIEHEKFAELLWIQAKILPTQRTGDNDLQYSHSVQIMWNELIKRITSLPDKVANIYKLSKTSLLWPYVYFVMMGKMMIKVLKFIHDAITASKDCSLEFLSQLFGKICMLNHGDELYSIILPEMEKLVKTSPLWCRICQKLFASINEASLEPVIETLLLKCKSYELVYQLLGDVTNRKGRRLNFLMSQKFLLYRHYKRDTVPFCIMGYLSKTNNGKDNLLIETLKKLLDTWGDSNALKHTSVEHHLYVTKCILLAIGFLRARFKSEQLPEQLGTALTMKLLDALPPHLESPVENFRNLGMIVAEEITKFSKVEGIEPLEFDFPRNEEVNYLSSIAKDPLVVLSYNKDEIDHSLKVPEVQPAGGPVSKESEVEATTKSEAVAKEMDSDLDSDDDLEPYLMDEEDESIGGVRPPAYLADCISGLLSNDDPARFEASLAVAEKLIRKTPIELQERAVELVKVLLYLQDNYNTSNFVFLRHGAMVAAAVKCPKKVIDYLTAEFYQENYNLRQRMDMLEVISAAALELSQPVDTDPKSLRKHVPLPHVPLPHVPGMKSSEKPDWQLVVEERIKSKTRMISQGRRNPEPIPVANRFYDVAGDFFFPLLKNFDNKCNTFDLLGQDFVVLGKLIHTLGTIVQASSGLSVVRLMTSAILDFTWGLRFHREPFVRQALLYALCMCLLSCPAHFLLTDLNSEVMECHGWVTDVAHNDVDTDCQKLALRTLVLLDKAIKNEFS